MTMAATEPATVATPATARQRVDRCLAFDGSSSAGALAVMDLFLGRALQRHAEGHFIEFGTFKGRSAALFAQHANDGRPLQMVEQSDYPEMERLLELSPHVRWHRAKSEAFCRDTLPGLLQDQPVIASHHDASHFFDNVATELEHVAPRMHHHGIMVLGDCNDTFSQVRAAHYWLRFAKGLPFEVLLVGFNKCVLVHEAAFAHYERFVLYDLLWELRAYRIDAMLARTDVHPRSRGFHLRVKASPDEDEHYGRRIWGDRFYQPSAVATSPRPAETSDPPPSVG